ncbi:uncharacterized protein LOC109594573 [Aethina tumida]|uniref:uncharacterized protein LOC109594573 n=1 Tax=Aethina tumida TaxID=116153 RepID=UPI00096B1350|nr:uncharacterized protein LOC109594573 [Aethina tumida]
MTTSVYKPIDFGLSRTVDKKMFCRPGIQRVKRALFEVDHEATKKFIKEEFEKIAVTESERWNFDFKRERTLNPDGNLIWYPVAPQIDTRPTKRTFAPREFVNELYAQPDNIIRPKAVKLNQTTDREDNNNLTKTPNVSQQKSIKDFLPVKRQIPTESKKTSEWTPAHPTKKIKIGDS